jgi:predicted TIM-barrel fold metal-dependent hydrolase
MPKDYTIEKHIEFMDRADLLWSLSWISSPHPNYGGDTDGSAKILRQDNEKMAQAKRDYPKRLGFAATLPLPSVDKAIEEAVYALDTLKADAIKNRQQLKGTLSWRRKT